MNGAEFFGYVFILTAIVGSVLFLAVGAFYKHNSTDTAKEAVKEVTRGALCIAVGFLVLGLILLFI